MFVISDLKTEDIIVIVLSASVMVVTAIALIFYRSNMHHNNLCVLTSVTLNLITQLSPESVSLIGTDIDLVYSIYSCVYFSFILLSITALLRKSLQASISLHCLHLLYPVHVTNKL